VTLSARPVLVIQAGATLDGTAPAAGAQATALDRIFRDTSELLAGGAAAVAAVVAAVTAMEADPQFNAGLGSKLQADGAARLSAAVMDGTAGRFGAVVNVQRIHHPTRLALQLLAREDRVLDATGADRLADECREPRQDPVTPTRLAQWRERARPTTGTVGAVARDVAGRLAAATSTGGRGGETVGRVSDSCTVAGNYADNLSAISCTGVGEEIVEAAVAARLAAWVGAGIPLRTACQRMEQELRARHRRCGFIAVDSAGTWAAHWTTAVMAYRGEGPEGRLVGWPDPLSR
jgi:L-asparaginase